MGGLLLNVVPIAAAMFVNCSLDTAGLDALAGPGGTVSDVYHYVASKDGHAARAELLAALKSDARFAKGTAGYDLGIMALASVAGPEGRPLLDDAEQVKLLLDAVRNPAVAMTTRFEIVQRLPVFNAPAAELAAVYRELLADDSAEIVTPALHSMQRWRGLDRSWARELWAFVVEPEVANPLAIESAKALDARDAEFMATNVHLRPSHVKRLRISAAAAWVMAEEPRAALATICDAPDELTEILGLAMFNPLTTKGSALLAAGPELQSDWVKQMGALLARPDGAPAARCCAAQIIVVAASKEPAILEACKAALEQIAAGHRDDPDVQSQVNAALEVLERAAKEPKGPPV